MNRLATLLIALAACGKTEPSGPSPAAGPAPETRPTATGPDMVLVPAGEFTMGDATGRPDEGPPHAVRVDAFWMDRHPVTQEAYQKLAGGNPSKRVDPKKPVERIQWVMAARFCNLASEKEGLTPCYDADWNCDFEADGYRLPTEAEREYAARAGSAGKYSFGDDASQIARHGWCKPHSMGAPQPVATKQANRWGLYDLHGNVWEWCNDWYGEGWYKESPKENPRGPAAGTHRVLRGGAADAPAERCTSSYRFKETPVFSEACFGADHYGFRRVRSAAGKKKEKPAEATKPTETPKPAVAATPAQAAPVGKLDPKRLKGTLVFVSDRSGALDLWTMTADGRDAKALTADANLDADPRFSPDGKRILYTSLRGGFPEVWLMNRDGSDAKKVCAGSQGAWSPDGASILFIRDNQAWVRSLADGKERKVVPDAWERCGVPAWHPDGTSFAVASRHEEQIGIYLLTLDGKEKRRLKTSEAACTPVFSKDGKRMLFQTVKGRIHEMKLEGASDEPVTFGGDIQHEGRYSPDGKFMVFARAPAKEGPWQLCVADLESDDLDTVTLPGPGSNSLPDWAD